MKRRLALLVFCIGIFTVDAVLGQLKVYSEHIALDSLINTSGHESNIMIDPDGNRLFFSRSGDARNSGGQKDKGDIWVSELSSEGQWTTPYNVSALNDDGENIVIGFLSPSTILFRNKDGLATCRIVDGKYVAFKKFYISYFKSLSEHLSGSVSIDSKYIMMGMESFGNYGVEDIYVCQKREDGSWSTPKNLGSIINSKLQETNPFLAPDNKTLFFSSNGHGGEGSFDIFMSTRLDETWLNWTEPVNLGNMLNTSGQESAFVFQLESEFGYAVTTQNSEGYGDIVKVKIQPDMNQVEIPFIELPEVVEEPEIEHMVLTGRVFNGKTNNPLIGAQVVLESKDGMKRFKVHANSVGKFVVKVEGEIDYLFKVSALHYMSYEEELKKEDLIKIKNKEIGLNLIEEGMTMSLDHVLFEKGTAVLSNGSHKELDLVVEMMQLNPEVSIFLSGHTDNQGNSSANIKLSQERVETVKKYLITYGVKKGRISGKGFGGTKPRASNANPETRKLNRRVEFTIHVKNG
ncbi:MAG: OmpA family protein [Reichenbachiella sp.]